MSDLLTAVHPFTEGLQNFNISMVESSANLRKQQQDRLLDQLQKKLDIFLSYEIREG